MKESEARCAALHSIAMADEISKYISGSGANLFDSIMAVSMVAARLVHAAGAKGKEDNARELLTGGIEAALRDCRNQAAIRERKSAVLQ
jgi:hypothetical protein